LDKSALTWYCSQVRFCAHTRTNERASPFLGVSAFFYAKMSILDGILSLGQKVNKVGDEKLAERSEGLSGVSVPELELSISDDELLKMKREWEKLWEKEAPNLRSRQDKIEKEWLGRLFNTVEDSVKDVPKADNSAFEALETFIPMATRSNPEPLVRADDTPEGRELALKVRNLLAFLADTLCLKLTLKQCVRYHELYFLGPLKVGWDAAEDEITVTALRPHKLILDPNACVVNGVYQGDFIGEYRKDKASVLADRFPNAKALLESATGGNMGTYVQYQEWWTDDMVFWTLKDKVLAKARNPHWNWDGTRESVDEMGNPIIVDVRGNNHFNTPQKPYIFLSVFSVGLHPWSETSLMEQALALQSKIQKRIEQIDRNADETNGGCVISGDHFDKTQAAGVSRALREGGTVYVPRGDVNRAFQRVTGTPLPSFVYESLIDYRTRLQDIFGIRGTNPSGIQKENTVRGKILNVSRDADRIGGGISEYLEQVADRTFNWFVQLMYVHYTEAHVASVIGRNQSVEYSELRSSDFDRKLTVSVKEGSLLPKDSLTRRNEAVDLFTAGALAPIDLYDRLEDPNPQETESNLIAWQSGQKAADMVGQPTGVPVPSEQEQAEAVTQEGSVPSLNEVPIP